VPCAIVGSCYLYHNGVVRIPPAHSTLGIDRSAAADQHTQMHSPNAAAMRTESRIRCGVGDSWQAGMLGTLIIALASSPAGVPARSVFTRRGRPPAAAGPGRTPSPSQQPGCLVNPPHGARGIHKRALLAIILDPDLRQVVEVAPAAERAARPLQPGPRRSCRSGHRWRRPNARYLPSRSSLAARPPHRSAARPHAHPGRISDAGGIALPAPSISSHT
jgi:hypothetical protein